jgi:hypothetical protein
MATFRVEKNSNYTVMSNYHLKDRNLSLKAKGLLSVMLSLPEDWDYSIEGLCSITNAGETSINSAIKELEEQGYLTREQTRTTDGHFDYIYNVYENPTTRDPGFRPAVERYTGNRPLYNTNTQNTNNKNTTQSTSSKSLIQTDKTTSVKQRKLDQFVSDKLKLTKQFEFTEEVNEALATYFQLLADMGALLPDIAVEAQLKKLYELSEPKQLQVINLTITRAWKSLDYAIMDITKQGRASFDTAKGSHNQFKSEASGTFNGAPEDGGNLF